MVLGVVWALVASGGAAIPPSLGEMGPGPSEQALVLAGVEGVMVERTGAAGAASASEVPGETELGATIVVG